MVTRCCPAAAALHDAPVFAPFNINQFPARGFVLISPFFIFSPLFTATAPLRRIKALCSVVFFWFFFLFYICHETAFVELKLTVKGEE